MPFNQPRLNMLPGDTLPLLISEHLAGMFVPVTHVPLWCKSNYSFLEGSSHPEELIEAAIALGLPGLAPTAPPRAEIDALACPRCSTPAQTVPMVVLAFLSDPEVVGILKHLGLPTTVPALAPARSSAPAHAFALPEEGATSAPDDGAAAGDFGEPKPSIRPPP